MTWRAVWEAPACAALLGCLIVLCALMCAVYPLLLLGRALRRLRLHR